MKEKALKEKSLYNYKEEESWGSAHQEEHEDRPRIEGEWDHREDEDWPVVEAEAEKEDESQEVALASKFWRHEGSGLLIVTAGIKTIDPLLTDFVEDAHRRYEKFVLGDMEKLLIMDAVRLKLPAVGDKVRVYSFIHGL